MGKKYDDEIEIDLLELLRVLLDNWIMIALSTFLMAMVAVVLTVWIKTPMYSSTSKLYVLSKSTSITSISDIQIGNSLTYDYMEVVGGRPVIDNVIHNLNLEDIYDYKSMRGKVSISNPSGSRMMEITVVDADPKMAKTITDEIADVSANYIAQKMDQAPPTVLQYGYDDGGPVSPNKRRTVLLYALIGALVSMILIIINHLVHDTILTPDQLENKLGINVLGTLPLEEGEPAMKAVRKRFKKGRNK